jgi:hypothetical protein
MAAKTETFSKSGHSSHSHNDPDPKKNSKGGLLVVLFWLFFLQALCSNYSTGTWEKRFASFQETWENLFK